MTKHLLLPLAVAAALLAPRAQAQPIFQPEDPDPAATAVWPTTVPSNQVLVVALKEPGKRTACTIALLTPEELICAGRHGGKPTAYKPAEVEAIINPREHYHEWLWALIPTTIGGAIMYGAVLLNPLSEAAAVTVGIVAAAVILSGGAALFSDDADQPDRLLYLAPGLQLSVSLRK